jgi:hypothetical protein
MDDNSKYNWWTNYETWNVKLWIDNDEGMNDDFARMARNATSPYAFGKEIKDIIEEMKPEVGGMFADLLNAALSVVNWEEIAENMMEEYKEEEE